MTMFELLALLGAFSSVAAAPTTGSGETVEASAQAGFWPTCSPEDCAAPDSPSVLDQFTFFPDCLQGPMQYSPGCGCGDIDFDLRVTLRDFAMFANSPFRLCRREFAIVQGPGEGYCPELGTVYAAIVTRAVDGTKLLIGTLVQEVLDPVLDTCDSLRNCILRVPFPARELTPDDAWELYTLEQTIPECSCTPCNWAFDPCVIIDLICENQSRSDYCFGGGNATYLRQLMRDLLEKVTSIARGK